LETLRGKKSWEERGVLGERGKPRGSTRWVGKSGNGTKSLRPKSQGWGISRKPCQNIAVGGGIAGGVENRKSQKDGGRGGRRFTLSKKNKIRKERNPAL